MMFWFLGVSAQQFRRNLNASVKVCRWRLRCLCSSTFMWEYNMFLQATMISLVCITWISNKQHLQHKNETQLFMNEHLWFHSLLNSCWKRIFKCILLPKTLPMAFYHGPRFELFQNCSRFYPRSFRLIKPLCQTSQFAKKFIRHLGILAIGRNMTDQLWHRNSADRIRPSLTSSPGSSRFSMWLPFCFSHMFPRSTFPFAFLFHT